MRIPLSLPALPQQRKDRVQNQSGMRGDNSPSRISPAGCCAQVCTPLGCTCVLDLPVCP
jgi:hypothetical protein